MTLEAGALDEEVGGGALGQTLPSRTFEAVSNLLHCSTHHLYQALSSPWNKVSGNTLGHRDRANAMVGSRTPNFNAS